MGYSLWDHKELDMTEQLTLLLYGGMKAPINKEQRDCTSYFSISFPSSPSLYPCQMRIQDKKPSGRQEESSHQNPTHPDLRLLAPKNCCNQYLLFKSLGI